MSSMIRVMIQYDNLNPKPIDSARYSFLDKSPLFIIDEIDKLLDRFLTLGHILDQRVDVE